jgi:hypothetical protein
MSIIDFIVILDQTRWINLRLFMMQSERENTFFLNC